MTKRLVQLSRKRTAGSQIDLDLLIEKRLLIQGGSGSGKSTLARQILEQTRARLQQIVIDPEGEFSTLRSIGDYLHCGADGDIQTDVKTAYTLAKRIRATGVSAIVDIYELKSHQRLEFVDRFLQGLMDAPKRDWRECLLFIDETHVFAPQARSAVSLAAVQDIAARGRKRRIGLICATHRLPKIHKDVIAELFNRYIGQTGLQLDLKSAAEEMGITYTDARAQLVKLRAGEFYGFGPAIAPEYSLFRCDMTKTEAPGADTPPVKASASLSRVIGELADLDRQATLEARSLDEMKKQNAALQKELRQLKRGKAPAGVSEADVKKRIAAAVAAVPVMDPRVVKRWHSEFEKARKDLQERTIGFAAAATQLQVINDGLELLGDAIASWAPPKELQNPSTAGFISKTEARRRDREALDEAAAEPAALSAAHKRMLAAIGWFAAIGVERPEQPGVAFLAGYRYGGGGFNSTRKALADMGLIEASRDGISLTDAGRRIDVAQPAIEPGNEGLHEAVMARLGRPEQRVLQPLLDAYPEALTIEQLLVETNYNAGGGFNSARSKLKTLSLIEYPATGLTRARDILFPDTPQE